METLNMKVPENSRNLWKCLQLALFLLFTWKYLRTHKKSETHLAVYMVVNFFSSFSDCSPVLKNACVLICIVSHRIGQEKKIEIHLPIEVVNFRFLLPPTKVLLAGMVAIMGTRGQIQTKF